MNKPIIRKTTQHLVNTRMGNAGTEVRGSQEKPKEKQQRGRHHMPKLQIWSGPNFFFYMPESE